MSKRVISFFLVLLVLTLTSCSFNPIDKKIKELQNASEVETYTFTEKVLMFMGTYTPQLPSGANPSFLIRNSTGSNMFEMDHFGVGRTFSNFTIGGNLNVTNNINVQNNLTIKGYVIHNATGTDCPIDYINSTGSWIFEHCDGSKLVIGGD